VVVRVVVAAEGPWQLHKNGGSDFLVSARQVMQCMVCILQRPIFADILGKR
jgi:hypothetical protein